MHDDNHSDGPPLSAAAREFTHGIKDKVTTSHPHSPTRISLPPTCRYGQPVCRALARRWVHPHYLWVGGRGGREEVWWSEPSEEWGAASLSLGAAWGVCVWAWSHVSLHVPHALRVARALRDRRAPSHALREEGANVIQEGGPRQGVLLRRVLPRICSIYAVPAVAGRHLGPLAVLLLNAATGAWQWLSARVGSGSRSGLARCVQPCARLVPDLFAVCAV